MRLSRPLSARSPPLGRQDPRRWLGIGSWPKSSSETGNARDQFGRWPLLVLGMFGRSATDKASSSVAATSTERASASALWAAGISSSIEAAAGSPVKRSMRSRSARSSPASGCRPSPFCSARSLPLHKPARVGRSWVVIVASALRG